MEWIQIALEEYKTLRQESLDAIKAQHATLSFGTGTISVIFISGFGLWNNAYYLLPRIIFLVFVPAICYIALVVWIGELARMMRVGQFLMILEMNLNYLRNK